MARFPTTHADHGMHRRDDRDDSRHDTPAPHGVDDVAPVAADHLTLATFHYSDTAANGSFHDRFILQANGATLNGAPVTVPGLDTAYGLYLTIDTTGHPTFGADGKAINGANVFDTLDVKVMLDPGHNNGAAHSTIADGLGFANGTADDIELAHGSIVSGHFIAGPDTNGHADFVESLTMTRPGMAFLGGSVLSGSTLEEILTSPFAARVTVRNADGSQVSVLNGQGTATAAFGGGAVFGLPGVDDDGSLPALLRTEFIAAHGTMGDDCSAAGWNSHGERDPGGAGRSWWGTEDARHAALIGCPGSDGG